MPLHYNMVRNRPKVLSDPLDDHSTNTELIAAWQQLAQWFGYNLATIFAQIPFQGISLSEVEEIRLRIGQALLLQTSEKEIFLGYTGEQTTKDNAYRVSAVDLSEALERMTLSSLYAAEEELRQGFLTLPGGHRVGVTGEAVLQNGRLQTLKHISALNLRLAHEVRGRGIKVLPWLLGRDGSFKHTLVLSAPRAGKTTLLRDLIRLLSEGVPELGLAGKTVGVVDERGEIAGMWQGKPTYDLGCRTDILDACPKAIGISLLVRSMAPQIIAMDELGHPDDVEAVADALRTGVKILSTAHAGSLEEARERPILRLLFEQGVFERVVLLSRKNGPGTIEGVIDPGSGGLIQC